MSDWTKSWENIMSGGPLRWKEGERLENYRLQHQFLVDHNVLTTPARVFVPLAGDGIFTPYIHRYGHTVVANDIVPAAVESLKNRFNEEIKGTVAGDTVTFTADDVGEETTLFKSADGRAAIWQCSLFQVKEEPASFDMVFDKDAFGALPMDVRQAYVDHVAPLVKPGGYVFLEGKDKAADPDTSAVTNGPPFHISDEAVRDLWETAGFEVVERVPSFYPTQYPHWAEKVWLLRKRAS